MSDKQIAKILRGLQNKPELRKRFLEGLFVIEREAKIRQRLLEKKK